MNESGGIGTWMRYLRAQTLRPAAMVRIIIAEETRIMGQMVGFGGLLEQAPFLNRLLRNSGRLGLRNRSTAGFFSFPAPVARGRAEKRSARWEQLKRS
jgi:hypothetical protein